MCDRLKPDTKSKMEWIAERVELCARLDVVNENIKTLAGSRHASEELTADEIRAFVIDQLANSFNWKTLSELIEAFVKIHAVRPAPGQYLSELDAPIQKALQKLRKDDLIYFEPGCGWAFHDFEERRQADKNRRDREFKDRLRQRARAHHEAMRELNATRREALRRAGVPEDKLPPVMQQFDDHERQTELVVLLEAKAAATPFPHEAASFRAKADQMRQRLAENSVP